MKQDSQLAQKIAAGEFFVTAELLPKAGTAAADIDALADALKSGPAAVNVADNPHGPIVSSLAGSVILNNAHVEPVYQLVTRDRNRIAIQSDLLGAATLGIRNVLCLSGHHQALTKSYQSANVYDIDSIQLIAAVKAMRDEKVLLDGSPIDGEAPFFIGAVANPDMKPMDLNMMRLAKKVAAGAQFIQTQAVFDIANFTEWMGRAVKRELTATTAILAGVMPLESAEEAKGLRDHYTDLFIPDAIIQRLEDAGDAEAQKKEGLAICVETITAIKKIDGVSGIHILSGGKEHMVSTIIAQSEL